MRKLVTSKGRTFGNIFLGFVMAVLVTAFCKMDIHAAISAAPSNVHQVDGATTITEIKLAWNRGRSNIGKQVYYYYQISRNADFKKVFRQGRTSDTEANVFSLGQGMEFYVRVGASEQGYNGIDQAPDDIKWSGSTKVITAPICSVQNLKRTGATASTMKFSWKKAWDADGYEVSYYKNNNTENVIKKRTRSASITLTGLKQGESYTVQVSPAKISGSYWAVAENCSVTVTAQTTFKGVTGFENVSCEHNQVVYKWNSVVSGVAMPDVYRFDMTSYKDTKFKKTLFSYATESEGQLRIQNHKIKAGSFYLARVLAGVRLADGKYAFGKSSTVIAVGTRPKKVSSTQSGKGIKVSWSKVNGATGYEIYVSTKPDSGFKKIATTKGSATSYTIKKFHKKALKQGSYYVKVVPVCKQGGKTYRAKDSKTIMYDTYIWYYKK
ncbi:MAG: fibronectin type III domain-containing protein [Lachnospiraceae bacterium]|nr:fibronectin type III domain-containing protein [Lachnospiraceae bacterium]